MSGAACATGRWSGGRSQDAGLNRIAQKIDGTEHPAWHFINRGHDDVFHELLEHLAYVDGADARGAHRLRPVEFAAWRAGLPAEAATHKRLSGLLDILEGDPDYWVHVSY